MKKTILAMVLMGSGAAALAQDSLSANNGNNMNNNGNMNTTTNQVQRSTGDYPAYGSAAAPSAIQYNFNKQYPGTTDAKWQQTYNGYWRATYRQNGKPMNVYYDQNGQSFNVALPVLQSGVSEDVVNKAMDLYGNDIYDINMVKGHDNQNHYMVRIIENGQLRAERMKEDGTAYVEMSTDMNTTTNGTNTNGTNTNSKSTMRSSYYSESTTTTDSTNMMNNGTNLNQSGSQNNTPNSGTIQNGPSAEGYGIDDTITDDTNRDTDDTETSEPNSELYNGGTRTELEYEEYTEDYEVY